MRKLSIIAIICQVGDVAIRGAEGARGGVCQNLAGKRFFVITSSSLPTLRNPLRPLRLKKTYSPGG